MEVRKPLVDIYEQPKKRKNTLCPCCKVGRLKKGAELPSMFQIEMHYCDKCNGVYMGGKE